MLSRWQRLHFSVSRLTYIVEGVFDVIAATCTHSEQYFSHRYNNKLLLLDKKKKNNG